MRLANSKERKTEGLMYDFFRKLQKIYTKACRSTSSTFSA